MRNVSGTNKDLLASCRAACTHAQTHNHIHLPSGHAQEAAEAVLTPPACHELRLCAMALLLVRHIYTLAC